MSVPSLLDRSFTPHHNLVSVRGFAYAPPILLGPTIPAVGSLNLICHSFAYERVQEYQPVGHRLRLSASP